MFSNKKNKLKAVKTLSDMGLKLIPVYGIKNGMCTCYKGEECASEGKHPINMNWKNHPAGIADLTTILYKTPELNLGVITGGKLVVIDIDPKNGGTESFKKIEHLFTPTFKVKTGSGGYHFYYYLPENYIGKVGNRTNVLKGIDIRGEGGFVVAPSSLHKSGNAYEIADDSIDTISEIPHKLLELITADNHVGISQRNTELIDEFGEGERNSSMTSIAGGLFRKGLSFGAVKDSLLNLNDTLCSPPLNEREIDTIVRSVSKYNNNQAKPDLSDENATPKAKVKGLLYSNKGNQNQKYQQIADLIIGDLSEKGKFYKTQSQYFYFDNESKRLILIEKENKNYKRWIASYGINAAISIYKFIYEQAMVYAEINGKQTEVFKYAHYNAKNNITYVKSGNAMYKITADNVTYSDNGTDGVLFSDTINVDQFEFIPDLDKREYIDEFLVLIGNYSKDIFMSVDTQKVLAKVYFVSLFMPEFLQTKPILVTVGSKGSGKTTLLKAFSKCLYGAKSNVMPMPNKLEDLDLAVVNGHFVAIDNLDSHKDGLADKLAVYATSGKITKRKLYTDSEMYEAVIDSFIGITTRVLGFRRDYVMQRLVLLFFDAIKSGYKTEADLINPVLEHRNEILSQAILLVQKVLQVIESGKYKNFKSDFRMSNFSRFMTMLLDDKAQTEKHLAALTKMQRNTTVENDILLSYLATYVEKHSKDESYYISASSLYSVLEGYATSVSSNTSIRNHFSKTYDNVLSFAKRLNNISNDISEYIIIETKRGAGNQTLYLLSKGERFDELQKAPVLDIV